DIMICDVPQPLSSVEYDLATADDLDETARQVRELGRNVVAMNVDVRSEEQLTAFAERGLAELGRIDIMVSNAGITGYAPAHKLTEEAWNETVDVNLKGAWL